jgi:hypothetical protein
MACPLIQYYLPGEVCDAVAETNSGGWPWIFILELVRFLLAKMHDSHSALTVHSDMFGGCVRVDNDFTPLSCDAREPPSLVAVAGFFRAY